MKFTNKKKKNKKNYKRIIFTKLLKSHVKKCVLLYEKHGWNELRVTSYEKRWERINKRASVKNASLYKPGFRRENFCYSLSANPVVVLPIPFIRAIRIRQLDSGNFPHFLTYHTLRFLCASFRGTQKYFSLTNFYTYSTFFKTYLL